MNTGDSQSSGDAFDRFPVAGISPGEIDIFLEQLSELLQGCEVTLPTEAEWECACRAGTRTSYAFGGQATASEVHVRGAGPVQVQSLPPNPWGLFEMHGNVGELCRDWLRDNQRAVREGVDPVGDTGASVGFRAVKGGSSRPALPRRARRLWTG